MYFSHCPGSIDSGSNHRNVEPETIEAMCNKHCNLTLGSPSVANMLDAMNLAALSSVVQRVQDQAATMLSEWLLLEAIGFIDVNDEGEDLEECQDAVDKGSAALLLLQQLHSVGAKLNDPCLLDASWELHICHYCF